MIAGLAGGAGVAQAGVFDGFGGREDAYLVGADRVCTPLAVQGGVASGVPACHKAASDEIAQLSVKPAKAERTDMDVTVQEAADAVESIITDGVAVAMNRYNTR